MRIEQLAVMAKQPHEQLHREDVSQESKVRPNCAHRLNDYPTCDASAGRSGPDYKNGDRRRYIETLEGAARAAILRERRRASRFLSLRLGASRPSPAPPLPVHDGLPGRRVEQWS